MCPKHRSETLKTIKDRLKENKATKVIATQVVEAGVDIDFLNRLSILSRARLHCTIRFGSL